MRKRTVQTSNHAHPKKRIVFVTRNKQTNCTKNKGVACHNIKGLTSHHQRPKDNTHSANYSKR